MHARLDQGTGENAHTLSGWQVLESLRELLSQRQAVLMAEITGGFVQCQAEDPPGMFSGEGQRNRGSR